jgi:hypothetical protein
MKIRVDENENGMGHFTIPNAREVVAELAYGYDATEDQDGHLCMALTASSALFFCLLLCARRTDGGLHVPLLFRRR